MAGTPSRKHHYIPEFYSKGFLRADGTFEVYEKERGRFRKQPQSAGSVFFEKERNTVSLNGRRTDELERHFSRIENGIAKVFALIRQGISAEDLNSGDGISILKTHVALQFWRLPANDGLATHFMRNLKEQHLKPFETKLGIPVEKTGGLPASDAGFRRYFQSFLLPLLTFDLSRKPTPGRRWYVLDVESPREWANLVCSDSPLVFRNLPELFDFSGPFAMALSSSKLLLATAERKDRIELEPVFSTKLAMLSFLQASRYVAGRDREFLGKMLDLCRYYPGPEGEEQLRQETLQYLE